MLRNTLWLSRAMAISFQVSRSGRNRILRSGAAASALGIRSAAIRPATASNATATAITGPGTGAFIITPAINVPTRMATKVPISTSALPPTSSESFSAWGRMAYFTGPKKADCTPVRNNSRNNISYQPNQSPTAATPMITTSANLIQRITADFSNRSATWPAMAENRKNGRINSMAARLTTTSADKPNRPPAV